MNFTRRWESKVVSCINGSENFWRGSKDMLLKEGAVTVDGLRGSERKSDLVGHHPIEARHGRAHFSKQAVPWRNWCSTASRQSVARITAHCRTWTRFYVRKGVF